MAEYKSQDVSTRTESESGFTETGHRRRLRPTAGAGLTAHLDHAGGETERGSAEPELSADSASGSAVDENSAEQTAKMPFQRQRGDGSAHLHVLLHVLHDVAAALASLLVVGGAAVCLLGVLSFLAR